MTEAERQSLELILYRLQQIETGMEGVKIESHQIGQIMAKLRLDEEQLSNQAQRIKDLEHRQQVTDEKQDRRILTLENMVTPRVASWEEAASTQKKLIMSIVAAAGGVVLGVVLWALRQGA